VGVRSHDQAGPSVAEMTGRVLFSSGFAVEVDDYGVGIVTEAVAIELGANPAERIFGGFHEQPSERIDDEGSLARFGIDPCRALAGRAGQVIDRAYQSGSAVDKREGFPPVPGMIAQRDRIGAGLDDLVVVRPRDAKPSSAAFSPLTMQRSIRQVAMQPGKCLWIASRPVLPTTSPTNRIRKFISLGFRVGR
jgi:hypothetical protein